MSTEANPSAALARNPSGLFILTARNGDQSTGMLASWVQQAGFAPLTLTVAIAHGRYLQEWVQKSKGFVLNQLSASDTGLLKHFGRGFGPDEDAFSGVELLAEAQGGPVLANSMGFVDCKVLTHIDSPDHRIYLAEVIGGDLKIPEAAPFVHTRRNATHY